VGPPLQVENTLNVVRRVQALPYVLKHEHGKGVGPPQYVVGGGWSLDGNLDSGHRKIETPQK